MYHFFHNHLDNEWKKCDIDGDGSISVPEFKVYLQKFFKDREMEDTFNHIQNRDVDQMIREIDTDKNGFIDKEEFVRMMNMSSRLHEVRALGSKNVSNYLEPTNVDAVSLPLTNSSHLSPGHHAQALERRPKANYREAQGGIPCRYARAVASALLRHVQGN